MRLGQLALAVALVVIAFARLSPESGRDTTDFRLLSQVRDMIVHRDRELLRDNLGNLLLFVPFGLALALCGVSLGASLALGFSVSLAVEVAQLLVVPGRRAAVDDVLLNSCGALLGWALVTWLRRTFRDR